MKKIDWHAFVTEYGNVFIGHDEYLHWAEISYGPGKKLRTAILFDFMTMYAKDTFLERYRVPEN